MFSVFIYFFSKHEGLNADSKLCPHFKEYSWGVEKY